MRVDFHALVVMIIEIAMGRIGFYNDLAKIENGSSKILLEEATKYGDKYLVKLVKFVMIDKIKMDNTERIEWIYGVLSEYIEKSDLFVGKYEQGKYRETWLMNDKVWVKYKRAQK